MEDVKAMEAVFSSDLMKDVLSKLSIRTHAQIKTHGSESRGQEEAACMRVF